MSDENNDVRRLQLQEERKAAARAKLKRLAMETVALTPDVTLEGCKILAVPLIRGVNLERTGTGFGDVQACQVSAFGGNGHSFSEYDDHLILTKMVEIFNGLLLQKVVGTPSLLNTSLTEKDVVTVEEEKTADPEAWAKIQSVLRSAYAGEDSVLRSGFFCPRFAGFWKAFHAPCKRRNYFNLQAVEGKKRYAKNVAGLLKPRNQKKKAPGGPNEPQKSGGEKNKRGDNDDDDDDDDEDDADDDCGRGGSLLGEVFSTERSRSMKAAESASKEKIHVFLYRIFRKKRDRNFVAPLPRTRPLPKVARVRSPLEDDGVDDGGADDISAITAKVKTMNVAGADVAAALESYENSLFSKVGSEDDDDDDSDMFSSSSSLDGGNAKSPDDDDDDDDAPTRPSSPDPFRTKSAANAKTLALDVELPLPPPIVLDSPSPSYLPFRDHSGNQAAGDNSYDRYYRYELAREGSAQNLYGDAGGDFDPRNYEVFGRVLGSATGCKNGDDVDLDVDAEDMGCVLIALVVDPNWDPNVALMTMCKNRTVHQLSANERSRALKKPGFFNPFLCDWSYETGGSHLSKTGFKEAEWNSWAKSYSLGRSSGGNSCGNRFDNCPVDPSSLTRPNLPPVFLSSEKSQSGGGGAGSSPAPDMSIAGSYSCDVLSGGASIEDPEDVFSLKNAVSWIEAYEGDADRLKFSVSEIVVTGRPDSLFQPLLASAAPSASSAAGHGKIVRCEFDRYPRHFYRIPYHRWSWPREKFAGLTRYFFPWCQDPVMSFLKHDVLGLKRSCLVEDKPLEYVVPVNVAENPESGRMEVKEHHVPSGVDVRSASLKKSRWRNVDVAENGSLQGFDLDQMDLPDRTTVQNIVEMHKNPGRGTFSTQLEADEVNDALNSALERKNGKLSPASKLNSLLMLQERFLPAYEMTLAEKPRETLAAPFISDSRSAMNSGATARWFRDDDRVSTPGGRGGRRNPFVRQFKRYVVLRERFEDLACRQLDSVLHDKNTILTDTVQALVGYEEKKIDAANFKYSCYDLASDAFSNHLDKLALEVRFLMNIAHTTHHFVLVMLAMYDATRFDFGLHFHILNSGPGSTGKSYTSEALLDCLVMGTVTKADDTTARAFNVEKDLSDAISFIDEMNKKSQDGGGGGRGNNKSGDAGDPQAAMLRRMLSGGQLVLAEHVWVELPNGKRVRSRREVVTSCQGCIMGNLNEENFSEATLTRFYRAVFSKTNIRFSNAVWTDMNRSDYHAFMTLFLNRVASGRSVSDLAHLARVEDVRAMVASEALTMSYLRKEQESSQLRKESLEDLDVDNNLLSKMGDFLTTKFLPVVNVPQAMFLENLVGEADSPMSKDNAPRKLTDKVRLTQVLITYVWKMIQEKALPDVNLTLAHMVAQKYFAALKRYANVELANYRVYSRIMIMCRIVAVLDNLLQLFAVDGCDVPPGQRFCLGLLKGLKPYMFCNTKHTVFALTLLADEYIGPHDSTIMTMFGKCCRFSDKAVSDELKSFRELNSVLNELKQVHTVDGLENALIDLVSEEQDPLKRAKLEGILSSKEVLPPPPPPPLVPLLASTKERPAKECDSVSVSATAPKVKAKNGPLFVISKKATSATVYDNDENDDDHDDPSCDPTSPAVPAVSPPTKSSPKNYDGHCHAELKKMIRRILNNELMPHEIYLVQAVLPSIQIQWDTESYEKVEDSELRDGGGGGGGGSMASTAASSFPKPSSSSSSSHNKALAVNLNGLVDHCSKWTLVNKIRSFMLGAGPSPQDVGRTLDALGTRAIVVPWSYKKPFSALEIGKMAGKTPEELEKEGFLVRNRSYPLCNLSVYGRCTVNFYALNGLLDPLAVIMKGLDSLIYRGMKPARYELGIMVDPNRGKFAWWDVTQKMIDSSPHRTFDIRTGSYMTPKEKYVVFEKRTPEKDRIEKEIALSDLEAALSLMQEKLRNAVSAEERSVRHFLNDAARSSLSSAPTVEDAQPSVRDVQASVYLARSRLEEEDAKGDPDEDGTLDAIRDASEWFLTPTGRKSSSSENDKFDADADPSSGAGFAHGQDVLRISADLDEWVAVRHFLNVGVPFGPHPKDENKLCWYYRPVRVFSYLTGDCRYDDRYLEYREFPTAYNQQMRSIFHLYTKSPLRYADMKSKGFVDESWTCEALKHFEWLLPGADGSLPAENQIPLPTATETVTTMTTTTTTTTTTSTTSDELSDSPSRSSTSPNLKRKVDGDGMEVDSNPIPSKQPRLSNIPRGDRNKRNAATLQRSLGRDGLNSFLKNRTQIDGK
jgi:hypothetical protein